MKAYPFFAALLISALAVTTSVFAQHGEQRAEKISRQSFDHLTKPDKPDKPDRQPAGGIVHEVVKGVLTPNSTATEAHEQRGIQGGQHPELLKPSPSPSPAPKPHERTKDY